MPETPSPAGPASDLVRAIAPFAPVFAGAVLSMAFGERLTIRGKLLSAAGGVAAAWYIAPVICEVIDLFWPGDGLPTSVTALVGFACAAFGMIVLSGLAQALARYSRDPLSLVRVKFGPVEIGGKGEPS